MNNDTNTDSIKRKMGIDDFSSVSNKQFENIQVLAGKGKITKEEMQLLVEMMPNFVQLQETEHSIEIAKILQETNKENNSLWKTLGSIAAVALVVVGTVFINSKKES